MKPSVKMTSIRLNTKLADDAAKALGVKSRTEAVHIALREIVALNDNLMESALKVSGLKTKKDAIEEGLKLLVQLKGQKEIKGFRGKLKWTGSLDAMRLDK